MVFDAALERRFAERKDNMESAPAATEQFLEERLASVTEMFQKCSRLVAYSLEHRRWASPEEKDVLLTQYNRLKKERDYLRKQVTRFGSQASAA